MEHDDGRATALTAEQIAELREQARREAGPFVDPRVQNTPVHNGEWAAAVLGRPYPGLVAMTWPELYMLHLAVQAEPSPPPPPIATAALTRNRAEQEQRQREAAEDHRWQAHEWESLASALRDFTGARVEVRHNYTSHRHLDSYTQGADHIIMSAVCTAKRMRSCAGQPAPAARSRAPQGRRPSQSRSATRPVETAWSTEFGHPTEGLAGRIGHPRGVL